MKKICFVPATSSSNQYVELVRAAIRYAGFDLSEENSLKDVLSADVVHFNWYEGIPSGNKWKQYFAYVKKMAVLMLLKALGKKIVFTLHNKIQHEKSGGILSARIMKWLICNSNTIVIHCEESRNVLRDIAPEVEQGKVIYVPHPNYIGSYPDQKTYSVYCKQPGETVLLFMGQVRPYKNVESVILAANGLAEEKNVRFLICGKCASDEYKEKIQKMVKSDKITLDLRFIADEELPSLMALADVVLLPYSSQSSLNSGAAYLAFSYGKTVLSTRIGTIMDFENKDLVYSYESGSDEKNSAKNLIKAIDLLRRDIQQNPLATTIKGKQLRQIMEQEHGICAVAECMKKAYIGKAGD